MADETGSARDFTKGIAAHEVGDGAIVAGRVGDEEVLIARQGTEMFAISAHCTHYHGPLAEGLLAGDTIRCPWHHACFSLRTGAPVRAPALDPVDCWRIEQQGDRLFVRQKLEAAPKPSSRGDRSRWPESVVIIGGGAAGLAASDVLRREGYDRRVSILSADDSPPCDRPNLSKDYLAGTAQEDWIPLRAPEFYAEQQIELSLNARVTGLDVDARHVQIEGGRTHSYGALLIATGADPVRLVVPGADRPHVRYLRSFADSKAIVSGIANARQAVVIGASFIGLEVAASLRARGVNVSVVAPESRPMERILGPEVGRFIQTLHESHGVGFHLGRTVASIDASRVLLDDQTSLDAELVVVGIGVRPALTLAQQAGSRSTGALPLTSISRPALQVCLRQVMPRAGPILTRASASVWSTGSSPSVRGRPRRETFSGIRNDSTLYHSSGASTTTSPSTTSATRSPGTLSRSTDNWRVTTAR